MSRALGSLVGDSRVDREAGPATLLGGSARILARRSESCPSSGKPMKNKEIGEPPGQWSYPSAVLTTHELRWAEFRNGWQAFADPDRGRPNV
jgi:hypothetical protein